MTSTESNDIYIDISLLSVDVIASNSMCQRGLWLQSIDIAIIHQLAYCINQFEFKSKLTNCSHFIKLQQKQIDKFCV